MRKTIFLQNKLKIEHTIQLAQELEYEMGLNHLSDWTKEELDTSIFSTPSSSIFTTFTAIF